MRIVFWKNGNNYTAIDLNKVDKIEICEENPEIRFWIPEIDGYYSYFLERPMAKNEVEMFFLALASLVEDSPVSIDLDKLISEITKSRGDNQ